MEAPYRAAKKSDTDKVVLQMKEEYMKAELELVDISSADIIVTSQTEYGHIQTIDDFLVDDFLDE